MRKSAPKGSPGLRSVDGAALLNADCAAPRCEYLWPPPRNIQPLLRSLLADPRDEPLLWSLLNVALVPPCALLLFAYWPRSHLAGLLYFAATYVTFLQRFVLALHCSQHRRLFRRGMLGDCLNRLPAVLCPFFGLPPGAYRLHHVVMHHSEGNAGEMLRDLSSTEGYQRDSVLACLLYVTRFAVFTSLELPVYGLLRARRPGAALSVLAGVLCSASAFRWLLEHAPAAATWACAVPFVVTQLALAFGNWSQHVFLNPSCPRMPHGMTYTCLNHGDNQRTFNDGYHVEHHRDSRSHWSALPMTFMDNLGAHAAGDALAFQGVHFFDVGMAVLCGRLEWLAARYVQLGQPQRSKEELVAELRRRLAPIRVVS